MNKINLFGSVGLTSLLLTTNYVCAEAVTVAYDVGANYTSTGFTGNQGTGFGPWTVSTPGGGKYISNDNGGTEHPFGLWNNTANSASTATRSFNSSLMAGSSFSLDFKLANLDNDQNRNGFSLLDSSGTSLFSFWHQGGDNADGHFSDANGPGTATGFTYNYQNFTALTFTLNSDTSYTFVDKTTGASFGGTLNGTIDQVTFFRQNLNNAPNNGQDFKFDNLLVTTSVPEPSVLALIGSGLGMLFVAGRRKV